MAKTIELVVPDLGDFSEVEIIEILVKKGDTVAQEDGLITLETDKAALDVPAPQGGVIEDISVRAGGTVSTGDVIGTMTVKDGEDTQETPETEEAKEKTRGDQGDPKEDSGDEPERVEQTKAGTDILDDDSAPEIAARQSDKPVGMSPTNEVGFAKAHASPSVRKLARELGADLTQIRGSGKRERILHDDVKAFVKARLSEREDRQGSTLPQTPKVDFAKFGEIDVQPLSRIQKMAGPHLQASWINLPHVTQHDEADITELEARRQTLKGPAKERGVSLTPLAFITRAVVEALKEFPRVNASLSEDGQNIVFKKYYHIGFAVDTKQGLVVPVIKDADKKDIYELASELSELSETARQGTLKADQLQGATFTISSLGGIGGTSFTPIVDAPQVGILGISRSRMQPVWDGSQFEPRLMLPLSFSYDHRAIDGAMAVTFTTHLGKVLADVETLLRAVL